MTLRPHHLLCVQGYQGKGYDQQFCEVMGRIAQAVARDPALPITVRDGPDDICAACPHLQGGRCTWEEAGEESVREHDSALLGAFALRDGDVTSIHEVIARLDGDPAALAVVAKYCGQCPWREDCLFAQRRGFLGSNV